MEPKCEDLELAVIDSYASTTIGGSEKTSASPSRKSQRQPIEVFPAHSQVYIQGWRLHILSLSIALCNFLVNIEVSIVGTAFVTITDDLHEFQQAGWIVTGYLVTYTSMLIIWTKLSDISARKPAILASLLIFIIFSGGCGASQTMAQLIVNRVVQGIGAAGCVSVALVIGYEMVPKELHPSIAARLATATALGSLFGPLIGGGISERATWRWVFLLNVPAGLVTMMVLWISMPSDFPRQSQGVGTHTRFSLRSVLDGRYVSRLDLSGAFLLVGTTMLLVTVLLEASNEFAWSSRPAIVLLAVSTLLWILFLINEWILTSDKWRQEPIFPWHFFFNRPWVGVLLLSLLSGVPYNVLVINIPQRFQVVYGISPFGAGLRLIPFNLSITLGCILADVIAAKTHIVPIYLLFAGSIIQLIGLALFSRLPLSQTIPSITYGWEVLSGCGVGVVIGILLVLPPHVVESRDLAISSGALLQFRVFGGTLGLAIASSVMNSHLTSRLSNSIGSQRLSELLQTITAVQNFPAQTQKQILEAFASGYTLQFKIMMGFACVQVIVIGLLWKKQQIALTAEKGN